MKKKIISFLALSVITLGLGNTAFATIGEFSNFQVKYSGTERFTSFETKEDTGNGAVNLSNDTGTAWITANMRNSAGDHRGGAKLQRGTRVEFKTPKALPGYTYRLGLKKTNNTGGGVVTIKGSWKPG